MSREPNAASRATRKLPEICVVLTNVTDTSVMPATGRALVTPGTKPDPMIVTLTSFPLAPFPGTKLVIVGIGLLTVTPPVNIAVPPPGKGFVTVTSREPPIANDEIDIAALSCVGLFTVTVFTVIPAPTLTVV